MPDFKIYFYLLLVCVCLAACNGNDEYMLQEQTPEYVEPATIELARLRENNKIEEYKAYLDSLYEKYYSRSLRDKFYIWHLYADSYGRIGDRVNAIRYTDSALSILENNPRKHFARDNYLWAYYFKADNELQSGHMQVAYDFYYKALTLAQTFEDKCGIGYYHLKIGLIMFDARQYNDALVYFRKAYENCAYCNESFGYFYRTQELLNDIALCYERLEQYDSAILYYEKDIALLKNNTEKYREKRSELLKTAIAIVKGNLGGVYVKNAEPEKAIEVLNEALTAPKYKLTEAVDYRFTQVKLAQAYIDVGKHDIAAELLADVEAFNAGEQNALLELRWLGAMWQYWHSLGNVEKAYEYLSAYKQKDDAFKKQQFNFSLANLDNNVNKIGNENKIANLEHAIAQRMVYMIALVVIAIMAIIIIILGRGNLRKSRLHVSDLQSMNDKMKQQSKKLNEVLNKLELAGDEKDRILKAVSHDMRSPVNSALALVDILESSSDNLNAEQLEYISLIRKSGENALNLTKDLLEVATLDTEKLEKELTDITAELTTRVKLLQFKAAEKQQQIELHMPANHISVNVNKEKVLRVISNLVNNAIKFSPANSSINVTLQANEDNIQFIVKDSGIGIPENMKAKVFDLFSEAKRFGTAGEQPFGLGLSISRQIVEAHSGKIWFESEEGIGTTFYVSIPL